MAKKRLVPADETLAAEPKKVVVPPYDYSLNYTHFRNIKRFEFLQTNQIAQSIFGGKAIKDERPHKDEIGKNVDVCRKLFGLGTIMEQMFPNYRRGNLDNHVFIPQTNLKDPEKKPMQVCLNCGSVIVDNKFYLYTDLN